MTDPIEDDILDPEDRDGTEADAEETPDAAPTDSAEEGHVEPEDEPDA